MTPRTTILATVFGLFFIAVIWATARGCARKDMTVESAAAYIGLTKVSDRRGLVRIQVWMRNPDDWAGVEPPTQAKVLPGMLVMTSDKKGHTIIGVTQGARINGIEVWGDEEELVRLLEAMGLN